MPLLVLCVLLFNLTYISTLGSSQDSTPNKNVAIPMHIGGFGVQPIPHDNQNNAVAPPDNTHTDATRQLPRDRAEDLKADTPQEKSKGDDQSKVEPPNTAPKQVNHPDTKPVDAKNELAKPATSKKATSGVVENETSRSILPKIKDDVVQSGAVLRGFYVFLGLSVVVMAYFLFRSYRLRRGSQPSTTVRKYGVVARRSDMEMRPLELEDEDDDTLFEISSQNTNR